MKVKAKVIGSDKFMNQVKPAVTIAEIKDPRANNTIVFLFDQSSGHTAYDSDALQVTRMNVNPGGSQPSHERHHIQW